MTEYLVDFLNSPHAITGSCIASWFLTSTSLEDIVDHPMKSIFWPLLCGGVAGKWISEYTPDHFEPYVAGGILALTAVGLVVKKCGLIKKSNSSTTVDIIETFANAFNIELNKNRVSYTVYDKFEDKGVHIDVDKPFTPGYLKDVLNNTMWNLDSKVLESMTTIMNIISNDKYLEQVSRIFIHDSVKGYVDITGPNGDSKHVLCININ